MSLLRNKNLVQLIIPIVFLELNAFTLLTMNELLVLIEE